MLTTLLLALLTADPPAPSAASPRHGGVVAPAALPPGTIAFWAQVGAPDLGVGYRQGFEPLELEARALVNVLQVSALVDLGVKVPVLSSPALQVSVGGSLGLLFNTGARYIDTSNFASVALRPRLVGTLGLHFSDLVTGVAQVEVPLAIALTVPGVQFTPTVGAGFEFDVGGRFSVSLMGVLGLDVIKEPLDVARARLAWGVRLGLGYRLF